MALFVVHHLYWDRKPSGSLINVDGVFSTWDNAIQRAVQLAINPEPDPGEIVPEDEKEPLIIPPVIPDTAIEMQKMYSFKEVQLSRNGVSFIVVNNDGEIRVFQIKPIVVDV
jgi:hypothetical protein